MGRRLRRWLDATAIVLLASVLIAALAILSMDAADPPGSTVFPPHSEPKNILGWPGSIAARWCVEMLGVAVYPALAAGLVLVFALFLADRQGSWSWRLLGWVVLVPVVALAADCIGSGPEPVAVAGPGGRLGAAVHDWLDAEVSSVGVFVITMACFIGAIGLIGDRLWPPVLRWLGSQVLSAWSRWRRAAASIESMAAEPATTATDTAPANEQPTENDTRPLPMWHGADSEAVQPPIFPSEPDRPEEAAIAKDDAEREGRSQDPPAETATRESDDEFGAPTPESATVEVTHPAVSSPAASSAESSLPPLDLLDDPQPFPYEKHDARLIQQGNKLERTFADFGINVRVVAIHTGPMITQYEVSLETGLRLHKVTRLADDIALNLRVPSVRMVAPIPGRDTVGIEVPNEQRAVVCLKELLLETSGRHAIHDFSIPMFLGKDSKGQPLVYDLADMPHLLIAGRTGTGKSVCMNAIILSILMTRRPDQVKMLMIDPKMLELSEYGKIPHLMHPVIKDMKKAEAVLAWAVEKMEERYDLLSRARVRNIAAYNRLSPDEIHRRVQPVDEEERRRIPEHMPHIVIFVDEMNDLMMTMRKQVEGHVIRLAQKSRAAGIHLVVATQKPTVDVITGLIKSNLPARICFQVASRTDSRVVLDEMGGEKLLGKGDMLFLQPGTSTIIRAQGTFASDREIVRVVEHLHSEPEYAQELVQLSTGVASSGRQVKERDELYQAAVEIVVRERRGSVSLLQRALSIGYGRAARLIDFMAEDGIVGPYNGSSAREVLIKPEDWEAMQQASHEPAVP